MCLSPRAMCSTGLSYGPVMDPAGFEPATTRVKGDNPRLPARVELGMNLVPRGRVELPRPLRPTGSGPAAFAITPSRDVGRRLGPRRGLAPLSPAWHAGILAAERPRRLEPRPGVEPGAAGLGDRPEIRLARLGRVARGRRSRSVRSICIPADPDHDDAIRGAERVVTEGSPGAGIQLLPVQR